MIFVLPIARYPIRLLKKNIVMHCLNIERCSNSYRIIGFLHLFIDAKHNLQSFKTNIITVIEFFNIIHTVVDIIQFEQRHEKTFFSLMRKQRHISVAYAKTKAHIIHFLLISKSSSFD